MSSRQPEPDLPKEEQQPNPPCKCIGSQDKSNPPGNVRPITPYYNCLGGCKCWCHQELSKLQKP